MLDSITLENFKCFERLYMPLKSLTLIAGANGAGKSSIIQAMLLLRQSCLDKDVDWNEHIVVSGKLVDLEDASQILYASADGDSPTINIIAVDSDSEIKFHISPESVDGRAEVASEGDLEQAKKKWPLFDKNLVYLYADRIEPKSKYQKTLPGRLDGRLGDKKAGNSVFRFVQAINSNEQIPIEALKHKDASDISVLKNVSAWINYIMNSSISVSARETEKDKEAKYIYTVKNKIGEEKTLSSLNMPFGQSYILPIVLAVLTAPKNSMVLIENPESHLHPSAQGKLGELLSRCANAGVQIIVETHSDHLMNGIRLACHNHLISNEDVEMDLIGIDNNKMTHVRKHIDIDEDGYVENWEPGFFDEWENALRSLIP